jgi:DNA-binding response OmpR family regulator
MSRLLLLEDHPRLADLIRTALNRAGMTCDVVSTLAQANAAVALMDYAAALLDRSVPDGDGLALVQQWRQRGSHLPCLILTARDALHDRVDGLESGADDYLCKPFQMEELVARVRALLRRPVRQMPTETRFDDLLLIPEQGRLVCGSHSQTLPQTEMQLLEVLLRAGGQPVRRTALEAAAWGLDNGVTPGALDVALHRLRRKLEAMGSRVHILNLRGIGYAVEA